MTHFRSTCVLFLLAVSSVEAFTTLATRPRPGVSQLFAANDDEPLSVADDSRRNVFRTAGAALATWAIAFAGPALDAANALDKDAFSIGQVRRTLGQSIP